MKKGGFSWKRFLGISSAKAKLSRQIGIPLTKSGRQRKIGKAITGGGCLMVSTLLLTICSLLLMLLII